MRAEHIEDLLYGGRPRFSAFLDEEEQALAARICERNAAPFCFWGGWDDAARRVLGVHLSHNAPFPVAAFQAKIPKGFALSHRDFLGAILALGIKREVVGDILIDGETVFFFTLTQAEPLVLQELQQIGRVGVEIVPTQGEGIRYIQRFEESTCTVASLRLDCVVAALTNTSRTGAQERISMGLVSVNAAPCEKSSRTIQSGEKLTVRGEGKFIVEADSQRVSRKGRLILHIKKYQ